MNKSYSHKGFTLVEMLVVVSIIAILSSVFLVGLSGFRKSAYDARRLSDLQKVQTYLEMYFNKHQSYPTNISDWAALENALSDSDTGVGINSLPKDPSGNMPYYYGVDSTGQSYLLGAKVSSGASAYQSSVKDGTGYTPSLPCGDGTGETIYCVEF